MEQDTEQRTRSAIKVTADASAAGLLKFTAATEKKTTAALGLAHGQAAVYACILYSF
ncbi:MAG: hypothetical protein ACLURV_12085 [Gallintestinimicrobium sp.]